MPQHVPEPAWPEGVQAVIAELAAGDYQVIVESSSARGRPELLEELARRARGPDATGAVAVLREGALGVAFVSTRSESEVLRVEGDATSGAVGLGALALRVMEFIRARQLAIPESAKAPPPAEQQPAKARLESTTPKRDGPSLWLGAGPLVASGSHVAALIGTLGVRIPIASLRLAIEPRLAASLSPLRLRSAAGEIELTARPVDLLVSFDIARDEAIGFGLGAGAGFVWLSQRASPNAGYQARQNQLLVASACLLARGTLRTGPWSFLLTLSPGVVVPAVSLRVDDRELVRFGRYWASLSAGVGFTPP